MTPVDMVNRLVWDAIIDESWNIFIDYEIEEVEVIYLSGYIITSWGRRAWIEL